MNARWNSAGLARATKPPKNTQARSPANELPAAAPLTPSKEDKPATVPVLRRFQWQAATGLYLQQFPGKFRLVIEGPLEEQEAVEAALTALQNS